MQIAVPPGKDAEEPLGVLFWFSAASEGNSFKLGESLM